MINPKTVVIYAGIFAMALFALYITGVIEVPFWAKATALLGVVPGWWLSRPQEASPEKTTVE